MIPKAVLRQRVRIDRRTGINGAGASVYAEPELDVPARLVRQTRTVRTPQGADVVATAVCQVRPGLDVPSGSLVTLDGESWEVLDVQHALDLSRPHHDDLVLDGPRPQVIDPEPEP